jgi:hypothetical protein
VVICKTSQQQIPPSVEVQLQPNNLDKHLNTLTDQAQRVVVASESFEDHENISARRLNNATRNVDRQVKGVRGTVVGDLLRENASNSSLVSENNLKESQLEKRVNGLDGEQEVLT